MILSEDGLYKFFYSFEGQLICVNRVQDGCTVWIPDSSLYSSEVNPSTREFLSKNYDLSDKPGLISQSELSLLES